jgi:hypothetical protein
MSVIWILIFTSDWGVKVQKNCRGRLRRADDGFQRKNKTKYKILFIYPTHFLLPIEINKYPWVIYINVAGDHPGHVFSPFVDSAVNSPWVMVLLHAMVTS